MFDFFNQADVVGTIVIDFNKAELKPIDPDCDTTTFLYQLSQVRNLKTVLGVRDTALNQSVIK